MLQSNPDPLRGARVLITGGAGFLGQALLRELRKTEVGALRLFDLHFADAPAPDLEQQCGDVRDEAALRSACEGVDAVIHAASLVDWGQTTPEELEAVNIGGAEKLLRVARECGARALVYTSTMDVICGTQPVVDADESTPFPARFTNDYARTKALAEQCVLAANTPDFRTCALRPCGMFGEGDPYHVANVLRIVKAGSLPVRPGSGRARFQHVYVGNVAHAHVLAVRDLLAAEPRAAGQSYFVTDDCPASNFFEFMEPILEALGYALPPRSRRMPYPVMLALGATMEGVATLCSPFVSFSPTLTRSSVRFVCHDHTFDGSKLRRELGYEPVYKESESIERSIAYFRELESRGEQ